MYGEWSYTTINTIALMEYYYRCLVYIVQCIYLCDSYYIYNFNGHYDYIKLNC